LSDPLKLFEVARNTGAPTSYLESVVFPAAVLFACRLLEARTERLPDKPLVTRRVRWAELRRQTDAALAARLAEESADVVAAIRHLVGADTSGRAPTWTEPPLQLLRALFQFADGFSFDSADDQRRASEAFSALVTEGASRSQYAREYATPLPLARIMVALANPAGGDRIYDPCFGTGGLLDAAASEVSVRGESSRRTTLHGEERNPTLHFLGAVRLLLRGYEPHLAIGDALATKASAARLSDQFDCILVDPPWGVRIEDPLVYDFPIAGKSSELMFLQHIIRFLRPGGRAVIALPQSALTRGGPAREVRRILLESVRVDLVLRFGTRNTHASLQPSLVVLRRAAPSSAVKLAELSGLPESADAYHRVVEVLSGDKAGAAVLARTVPLAQIAGNDYVLDPKRYSERDVATEYADVEKQVPLCPLKDVAQVVPGVALSREFMVEDRAADAVPVVRVSDVPSDGPLRLGARYLLPEGRVRAKETQYIRRGDVLLTIDGTIGRAHYVRDVIDGETQLAGTEPFRALAGRGVVIIRPHQGFDPWLLHALLKSATLQAYFRQLTTGTHIPHLSLTDLRKVPLPVPAPAVQERVVRRLSEQPADALEVLNLALRGEDDDELSLLFREHPAFIRLSGEGEVEPSHRNALALEVLDALRRVRNRIAHPTKNDRPRVSLSFYPWLMRIGSLPFNVLRPTARAEDRYEALYASTALLEAALVIAREIQGLLGRQAARLTERMLAWAQHTQQTAASDISVALREIDSRRVANGVMRVHLEVRVHGEGALRRFQLTCDPSWRMGILRDSQERLAFVLQELTFDLLSPSSPLQIWAEGDLDNPRIRLSWRATRLDGVDAEGELAHEATPPARLTETSGDIGVSPYVTGDVVDDPAMFFGRRTVIDDIRTHLGGGTKVILLEGNRRTGKTSILRQLQRPEYNLLDAWVPVECSFQGSTGHDTKDGIPTRALFRLIARDIGLACNKAGVPVPLPGMVPAEDPRFYGFNFAKALTAFFDGLDPYEALQIYVDMFVDAIAPRRLLLMLDEFDKVQVGIDNQVTSPLVPENIRNLLQTRSALAAIITGSRRLKRLREEYWSALFGFGHRIGIDPLQRDEAVALITRPVAGRLEYDPLAVDRVIELTAKQPFLMQSLCARIFELAKRHRRRRIELNDVADAVRAMVRGNEHFEALWGYAETERRRFLLCACHELRGGELRVSADLLTQRLDDAGIHVPVEAVDSDLKLLVELEIVAMTNTELGPSYSLAIPVMEDWMQDNCDCEAQRRLAVQEARGGTTT